MKKIYSVLCVSLFTSCVSAMDAVRPQAPVAEQPEKNVLIAAKDAFTAPGNKPEVLATLNISGPAAGASASKDPITLLIRCVTSCVYSRKQK